MARQRGISVLSELTRAFDEPPVSLAALNAVADVICRHEDVISLLLLIPVGKTLYIVSRGSGKAYLKRGNKLALLIEGSQALSGEAREHDVIIAASEGFVRALSPEDIIGVFDHLSAVDVAEKLTILLHRKEHDVQGGAALIFQVCITDTYDTETQQVPPAKPAAVAPVVRFSRIKNIGIRFLSVRQRVLIRQLIRRMQQSRIYTARRLVLYIVLLLFGGSVLFGWRYAQTSRIHNETADIIRKAKSSFDEGLALYELNPIKGREQLRVARDLLDPIVSRNLHTPEGKEAASLFAEVTSNLTRAMRIYTVTPELFFDVSLLKSNARVSDISLFEDTIAVLDANTVAVFAISIQTKGGTLIGGGTSFANANQIAAYGARVYVYTPEGIHAIQISDTQPVLRIIPKSPEWGVITDMTAYGGNLYLLDTKKQRIWKYIASESGFSDMYEYLNPDFFPDLSKAANMAIDGSVWAGTDAGSLLRFTTGGLNTFLPQGEDIPIGDDVRIYVSDTTKSVYVLDAEQYRAVVSDEDGSYKAQYRWSDGLSATQIVVSEERGKIFLLAAGKLYTITLQ